MIYLAYDGSINGDWVAWYALNLARHDPDRRLCVIYVDLAEFDAATIAQKINALTLDCERADVVLHSMTVPSAGRSVEGVFRALRDSVPAGVGSLLVCGARLRAVSGGYLAGTVSERLLSDQAFPVMAVHVVQPGLLGAPQRFLMPVAGDRDGFLAGAHILKRFGPGVARVHLLRVMQLKRSLFRHLQKDRAESLRYKGWLALQGLDEELSALVGIAADMIDIHVTVSDDWAQDVIIAAGRHKSHLILMEAARHDLGAGYLYGSAIEVVLRNAPCDVAIYRGV
ncbi:MAG: universal stress protein [Rhodospirillales bacterium]|nr:universal stress protein [Rhodospirillales bacterium]